MLQAEGVTQGTMRTAISPAVAIAPGLHGDKGSPRALSTVVPSARKGIPLAVLINSLTQKDGLGADETTSDGDVRAASDAKLQSHGTSVNFQDDLATRAMARVAERRGWRAVPLFPSERPRQNR